MLIEIREERPDDIAAIRDVTSAHARCFGVSEIQARILNCYIMECGS